jgi:hypothetical protein
VAVALADSTAAVSDVTDASVVPAVMPVAAMTRPASFLLNVPAAPVTAVDEVVVVTVTVRGSVVRPATISRRAERPGSG